SAKADFSSDSCKSRKRLLELSFLVSPDPEGGRLAGGCRMTGGWMTGGCWLAHPASNMAATISDRNFTVRSLAPFTPCARRYRCGRLRSSIHDDRRRYP